MRWTELEWLDIPQEYQKAIGGHPIVAQTLFRRGFQNIEAAAAFLDPSAYISSNPGDFPGIDRAVERLEKAILNKEKILVWGDFDVDGQTATSLLVSILRLLDADVQSYIPVRSEESHGIHPGKLQSLLPENFKVLLSCDTGIAAHEAVEIANTNQIDVIITDHHELPDKLPQAYAIINPRLLNDTHPFLTLPGVGVAFELGVELLNRAGKGDQASDFLDLVALGIIADLALLIDETRFLLQKGLQALRDTRRPGILAILERVDLEPSGITEDQVSFLIAPRLNALGRLGDANLAVELLTTQDMGRARVLALQLETMNAKRRLLTSNVFEGALAQISSNPKLLEEPVLILANQEWPAGVIGIVSSRMVERYGKPAILIAMGEDGCARGSARSIEGVNIASVLASLSEILIATGGHPMAAGFSLNWENLPQFRKGILRSLEIVGKSPELSLDIDGVLSFSELNLELVRDFDRLSPFGPGNPPLTLVSKGVQIKSSTTLGKEEEHLLITVIDPVTSTHRKVIWWQGAGWSLPDGKFDLAYRVRSGIVRGVKEIVIEWIDFQASSPEEQSKIEKWAPRIIDYRNEPHPVMLLKLINNQNTCLVFAEGEPVKKLSVSGISSCHRMELQPNGTLVLWTSPPGPEVMAEILRKVSPRQIYLFDEPTDIVTTDKFLTRLAGLVQYAIRTRHGRVNLKVMAALTAQREGTVKKGLDFLANQGYFEVNTFPDGELELKPLESSAIVKKVHEKSGGKPESFVVVETALSETNAYRRYYHQASVEHLLNDDNVGMTEDPKWSKRKK